VRCEEFDSEFGKTIYLQSFRKRANKDGIISIKQSHIACFDGETRATSFDNRKYIKENS